MRFNLFEGFMASATVLIMQQTQTPDLPQLSDQKIPLHHQVKIRDEDSAAFERVLPSASGPGSGRYNTAPRPRKVKNGIKKQPQRGLGVAKLENMRLQEEKNKQEQASCLAYAHMTIPLDSTCSGSFLHLHEVRPGAGYIELSPKLAPASIKPPGKTSPSPASTIPQGWDRFTATSVALLRPLQDGNSTNPYPSRYCADRKPGAGRFEEIEPVLSSASSSVLNKSPFLLSKATQRVFAETEGYTRTLKASVDVYPVKDHDQKVGSSSNVKFYTTTTMGTAGAINNKKMAFVDLNATESVNDIVSSPSLRGPQPLRYFQDGKQSVNGNSSKELSSFQNYTYHTAWFQTNKKPSKKRSRDSTVQENSTTSPGSLAYALSVVPSDKSRHSEDGARSRTEIQRNVALASTDNSSFLNLNKQEMSVCSPDCEDGCPKGDDITTKKDFLELSLSSSCFSGELDRKQEVHEHSVQDSNSIQVNEAHKCSKIRWFDAFHQKAIANDAETKQHLPCQKVMGECETRRFSSRDIPSKKLLVAEPSTHHDSESNLQHFGTNVCTGESASISILKVIEHKNPSKHSEANAEQILLPKDSQLNLSLDLSL